MTDLDITQDLADMISDPPSFLEESESALKYYSTAARTAAFFDIVISAVKQTYSAAIGIRLLVMSKFDILDDDTRRKVTDLNISRPIFSPIERSDYTQLIETIRDQVFKVKDNSTVSTSPQISSHVISVESTGITPRDLLGFTPSADQIKYRKALDSLSALDFEKRVPKIIFTAEYSPMGKFEGVIVGWRKMPDASGFILERNDVFGKKNRAIDISSITLRETRAALQSYVSEWVTSFYTTIDTSDLMFFLDREAPPDTINIYTLKAYQDILSKVDVFSSTVVPVRLSQSQLSEIKTAIRNVVSPAVTFEVDSNQQRQGVGLIGGLLIQPTDEKLDSISPYPAISKRIYGDEQFDWIIAATNVRAAFSRDENIETVRSFSYLGSSYSFISDQINAGNFYTQQDIAKTIEKIERSIEDNGVTNTIIEILDKTGLLLFFSKKDVVSESLLNISRELEDSTSLLSIVLSSIDPTNATINEEVFSRKMRTAVASISTIAISNQTNVLTEFTPPNSQQTNSLVSDDVTQSIVVPASETGILDLTTFDGLSRFIRLIRYYYDFNKDRDSTNSGAIAQVSL